LGFNSEAIAHVIYLMYVPHSPKTIIFLQLFHQKQKTQRQKEGGGRRVAMKSTLELFNPYTPTIE